MKNILIYILAVLFILPVKADGLQLFGSRKSSEKDKSNEQSSRDQSDDMIEDFTSSEVTTRKNIESVIPVKRIPSGWVLLSREAEDNYESIFSSKTKVLGARWRN